MNRKWHEFYKKRVNSGYHEYFEMRYAPMIDTICKFDQRVIREEGVGIGSVLKSLRRRRNDMMLYGFDLCPEMVSLAKSNLDGFSAPHVIIYQDDIINPRRKEIYAGLVVTHGVLEHFTDDEIVAINKRYKDTDVKHRVHYVPTDKYEFPSFGDERLLPVGHWLKLMKPKDYILFNDDHDLLLID